MSSLASIFDVVRGWDLAGNEGCALTWDFKQDSGAASDIDEGTVVAAVAASSPTSVDRWTSAFVGPDVDQIDHPWLVIRGRESSESEFTGNLTCLKLRTGAIIRIPTVLTMAPGEDLWANTGVVTNVDPGGGVPPIGKVVYFNASEQYVEFES